MTYVVPNEFAIPQLTNQQVAEGWTPNYESIYDDFYNNGHGTTTACAAGGRVFGVAADANLYLIKVSNYIVNHSMMQKLPMSITAEAIDDAMETIWDAFEQGIADPTKSVINLSIGK